MAERCAKEVLIARKLNAFRVLGHAEKLVALKAANGIDRSAYIMTLSTDEMERYVLEHYVGQEEEIEHNCKYEGKHFCLIKYMHKMLRELDEAVVEDVPEEHEDTHTPDAYEVGKQIVSLKGKAKDQQGLVKTCGDEFLVAMSSVYGNPVKVTMNTPDELRKCVCSRVHRAVRDGEYARWALDNARINAKQDKEYGAIERATYEEGWAKFLEEYATPAPELTVEERRKQLKQNMHEVWESRRISRRYVKMCAGKAELAANMESAHKNIEHYTEMGLEYLKEYRELSVKLAQKTTSETSEEHKDARESKVQRWPSCVRKLTGKDLKDARNLYQIAQQSTGETPSERVENYFRELECAFDDLENVAHSLRLKKWKVEGEDYDDVLEQVVKELVYCGTNSLVSKRIAEYDAECTLMTEEAREYVSQIIKSTGTGLLELTGDLLETIHQRYRGTENEDAVLNALALHNCEVLSRSKTREELLSMLSEVSGDTLSMTAYYTDGTSRSFGTREKDLNEFVGWYCAQGHPEYEDIESLRTEYEAMKCCTQSRKYEQLRKRMEQVSTVKQQVKDILKSIAQKDDASVQYRLNLASKTVLLELREKLGLVYRSGGIREALQSDILECYQNLKAAPKVKPKITAMGMSFLRRQKKLLESQLREMLQERKELRQAHTTDFLAKDYEGAEETLSEREQMFGDYVREVIMRYKQIKRLIARRGVN